MIKLHNRKGIWSRTAIQTHDTEFEKSTHSQVVYTNKLCKHCFGDHLLQRVDLVFRPKSIDYHGATVLCRMLFPTVPCPLQAEPYRAYQGLIEPPNGHMTYLTPPTIHDLCDPYREYGEHSRQSTQESQGNSGRRRDIHVHVVGSLLNDGKNSCVE